MGLTVNAPPAPNDCRIASQDVPCEAKSRAKVILIQPHPARLARQNGVQDSGSQDRKSTRLNSSHGYISYAVFCLKKKKEQSAAISHARPRLHEAATTDT